MGSRKEPELVCLGLLATVSPSGAGGGGTAGRLVTGGHDGHMLARDPARDRTKLVQLGCSVTVLAAAPPATKGPAW